MRGVALVAVLALAACAHDAPVTTSSPASPTAPSAPAAPARVVASLTAVEAADQVAAPGTAVSVAPTVIVRDNTGAPMAGIAVLFKVGDGDAKVLTPVAISDQRGRATSGRWTINSAPGASRLTASVDNAPDVPPVVFNAQGLLITTDSATYGLVSMAGMTLPVTYSYTGNPWTYLGGRWHISADGTFSQSYVLRSTTNGVTAVDSAYAPTVGTYTKIGSEITFYWNGYYYATGTIVDSNTLRVGYWDPLTFDDEVYTRSAAAAVRRP